MAHTLEHFTETLIRKESLSLEDATSAARMLADESVSQASRSAFLVALSEKGESVEEVAAFAGVFRELAYDPEVPDYAERGIDIVGTGGDGAGSFNISSTAAFIVASAGVPVLKHGNRSITSKCGSADFIAAAGFPLECSAEESRMLLRELNFTFFFAPAYHPAFKAIMPVRKALASEGRRTIFNILGPLINPAKPAYQLMGVFSPEWVAPLAGALHQLGLKSALVAHSDLGSGKGYDELTTVASNHVAGAGRLKELREIWSAGEYGLKVSDPASLKGGELTDNLRLLDWLMEERAPAGLRDTVLLNSGVALWLTKKVDTIEGGIALAREQLLGGGLKQWLKRVKEVCAK